MLSEQAWQARHRGIVVLLWVHVAALLVLGAALGTPVTTCLLSTGVLATCALAAGWARLSPTAQASAATLGLLASSAVLIGFFGGLIEAHFHFFVTIAVVSLYQSWRPYLLAVGFVLVHHLALGTLFPHLVYNHHAAVQNPWLFAVVHAGAVLAQSVACLVFWKVTEDALDAERSQRAALERTNDELTAANTAISDLVAMLAHDLRAPLTVLIGYAEMALESWPDMSQQEQLEFVRRASRAGQSLRTMLDDSLTVSALDGGGVEPKRAPVRVDEVVQEALAALPEPAPQVDLDDLTPVTALVDRGHLTQVLTNLFTNAVKYGDGIVTVSAATSGDAVLVRVTDAGPGVPESFVPDLFERFTRSRDARSGPQKGTGLGLYIARSLALANDGDLHYESTPGRGATFSLRLARPATGRHDRS